MNKTAIYNIIGKTYDATRKADPAIVKTIFRLLCPEKNNQKKHYLDIACGSGNYTDALWKNGLDIEGIDVSEEMLSKARAKNPKIAWHQGDAKQLPFENNSFDGATCILGTQHIKDINAAFKEAYRVINKGRYVIFTTTPEQMRQYWLKEYFPELIEGGIRTMENFETLKKALANAGFENIRQEKFFVTNEVQDWFLYAGKYCPEAYLNQKIRAGISLFHLSEYKEEVERGLERLEKDIKSQKIKEIIAKYENDIGDYLFVCGDKI